MKRSSFLKMLTAGVALPLTSFNFKDGIKYKNKGEYGSSFVYNGKSPYEVEIYNSKLEAGQIIMFPDNWVGYVMHTSETNGRKTAKVKSTNGQKFNPRQPLKYEIFQNAVK